MNKIIETIIWILLVAVFISCNKNPQDPTFSNLEKMEFRSSFESVDDFAGFYLTPQAHMGTSFYELSDSIVHTGTFPIKHG